MTVHLSYSHISIASPNWLVIGRQVPTPHGGLIDLLAIDRDGRLVVLELKRDRTPREVVAQLLDYASWVKELTGSEISQVFDKHQEKQGNGGSESFDAVFCKRFNVKEVPDTLNESHELVVVASALDDSTERIVTYLSETYGVPVNAVFFRVYKDGEREYLTRAWFRDPTSLPIAQEAVRRGDWNGEFYANFGNGFDWEQARKYGYIAAGGGLFYSRTLSLLENGGRVWVNSPGNGYVGVGIVEDSKPITADKFLVPGPDGTKVPLASIGSVDSRLISRMDDPENADLLVRVRWLGAVPIVQAIKETGFFGNQNTVCKPVTEKWEHTVNRLKKGFAINEST